MSENTPSAILTHTWQPGASGFSGFPVLLAHYQILGVLGEGGMGTVYKGYHLKLKRFVAIKTLRLDRLRRQDLVHRFVREMGAVGQMDHANVVRAFDAGEKNGILYLVMEYLAGIDLERLLAQQRRLPTANACELARQAALGLEYAHQTLVHRDIKPSNLMLTPSGLVKILDLGLVRLDEPQGHDWERTPEGCAIGTYDYIAPEQALGAMAIDGRADLYSLGCTLFKLLVGRAPYHGPAYDSIAKKLFAHCHIPLAQADGFAALPANVGAVLQRMTAKDPAQRYASAREAEQALAALAEGSRPLELLGQPPAAADASLRPLPARLPEEIQRLTEVPHDTPMHTPGSTLIAGTVAWSFLPPWAWAALSVAMLGASVGLVAFFAAAWMRDRPDDHAKPPPPSPVAVPAKADETPTLRTLDDLPGRVAHKLLDLRPVVVGCAWDDPQVRWNRDLLSLTVMPDSLALFQLGTTTRSDFTLEAGIKQAPWNGRVGIFWGYREDRAVKDARTVGQAFAWFQMICLWRETGPSGDDRFFVRRARSSLHYNKRGEIHGNHAFLHRHDVPYPDPERDQLVQIDVVPGRLKRARLGSIALTDLYSDAANEVYKNEPVTGTLGLITLQSSVTFTNVWFVPRSKN